MTHITLVSPADTPVGNISLYRAIWRWHFFAGLLVIPFVLNLAVTGSIYLFKDEINDTLFAYRNVVPEAAATLNPTEIVAAAEATISGSKASAYREAPDEIHSAMVSLSKDGVNTLVYVDPHNGDILGSVKSDEEFNWVVKKIHSLEYFGPLANRLVEIVGGFALVLVITGVYLWWPRGQGGGVTTVRGTPAKRVFWRDTHAVTGAFTGLLIFFLAATGMPWSGYWGANVNSWLTVNGFGYPSELWDNVPPSVKTTHHIVDEPGWVVENAPVPSSQSPATHDMATFIPPISLDKAVDVAKSAGMASGFEMAIPGDGEGVFTASLFPDNLAEERVIHIDQYSGRALVDISYDQYAFAGRLIEWGINVHQGQEYGTINQMLMLTTCLAAVLLCVSGTVMWWKRRPSGRIGVPPMPPRKNVYFGLWIIVALFGLAFPMTGIAIAFMLLVDQVVLRFEPFVRRALT